MPNTRALSLGLRFGRQRQRSGRVIPHDFVIFGDGASKVD